MNLNFLNRVFSLRIYPGFLPFAYWNLDHAVRSLSSNHHVSDAAYRAGINNDEKFARDLILGDKITYIPAFVLNADAEIADFLDQLNKLADEGKYKELTRLASKTAVHSGDEVGKEYQTFKPYGILLAYASKYKKNLLRDHWGPICLSRKRVSDELFRTNIWLGRHRLTFENENLTLINNATISVNP